MERPNSTITIFHTSRLFTTISEIIFHIVFILQSVVYVCCYRFRVRNRKHLKHTGQVIFVSNHLHYLDPGFVAEAIWPKRTYFSGLEETFTKNRLFSFFIRCLGGFPIPQDQPGRIIKPIGHILQQTDRSIHLFPEGRMFPHNENIAEFNSGAFSLALFFDLPVVPITEILRKRPFWPFPQVIMVIGTPVFPSEFNDPSASRAEHIEQFKDAVLLQMRETVSLYLP
ncbi:MAG: 1-acyl-sn-glycerol-3-phosphate acyltransferase [Spirochaetia bacterium]|nr:1-acyl-sn-glycerol-3-phosphate acyltransferase [Spirochaetia bacterium]MCF7940289.1 1-acyl-sn-glycerol-3-phosphate acyltransferase [Spirochaetia bacterium]